MKICEPTVNPNDRMPMIDFPSKTFFDLLLSNLIEIDLRYWQIMKRAEISMSRLQMDA